LKLKLLFSKYRSLILYGIIGFSGATLDFVVFAVLYNLFNLNPLIATAVSTSLGVSNNFILNIRFNFRVRNKLHHRYLLFYSVGIAGLGLSILIIWLLHDIGGMNANWAKLISIPIVVLCQYLINSRITLSDDFTNKAYFRKFKNG